MSRVGRHAGRHRAGRRGCDQQRVGVAIDRRESPLGAVRHRNVGRIEARHDLAELEREGDRTGVRHAAVGRDGQRRSRCVRRRHGLHLQRGLALGVDLEGVRADGFVGTLSPAATEVDGVARVAADQQRVAGRGDVEHFALIQRQRVVAAAGDVDDFDVDQLGVANGGQIQREAAAVQPQGVGAVAAGDVGEREIADRQRVVPFAAAQHVAATIADQDVVAATADDHVGRRIAGQRFTRRRARVSHRRREVAAEEHITVPRIRFAVPRRVG